MIRKGFEECFRVLKPNGTLIFKWNDVKFPVKEILKLTGRVLSEETKHKMRMSKLGKKQSKEHLEKRKQGLKNTHYKGRTILNTETNETFNSISEAARFYNIEISTLNRKLNGKTKNDTNLIIK